MYFFRVQPLKEQLAREGLAERDRFHYLLAWSILTALASTAAISQSGGLTLLLLLIAVAGAVWAYRRNGGPDGNALLDRYFSIGFVVSMRVLVVLIVAHAVIGSLPALREMLDMTGAIAGFAGGNGALEEPQAEPWTHLLSVLAEAWIAWSIGRHIGHVREVAAETPAPPPAYAPVPPAPAATLARLDRVGERLIQSEIQAGTALVSPRGGPRRSRVRVLRPRASRTTPRRRSGNLRRGGRG